MLRIKFQRTHPAARSPTRAHLDDVGWDLFLVEKISQQGDLSLFESGIVVSPPSGWYLEVVPRSSIIKTGYLLANSIGIIDPGYRGSIKVPLLKWDKQAPELKLPCRAVQLILRPLPEYTFDEVFGEELGHSSRGEGGFGSSGIT